MSPFRDATSVLAGEAVALAAARRAELSTTPTGFRSLYVRRSARVAAGIAGTVAAAAIVVAMAAGTGGHAVMLLAAWAVVLVAYAVAGLAAARHLRVQLTTAVSLTGVPVHDLDVLRAAGPLRIEHTLAGRRRHASYAWPLVAAVLLAPHTLHLVVIAVQSGAHGVAGFDQWMPFSAACTAHVFAYAVYAGWRFPRQRAPFQSAVIAALISLAPWILWLGIPSLVVLATALAVAALIGIPTGWLIDHERAVYAAAERALNFLDGAEGERR